MAWLRKKPKKSGGYVYHIVYDLNGKTKYKSTGTYDAKVAKSILEKFKADLTLEKFGISRLDKLGINKEERKRISLEDFIEEYGKARRHRRPNTRWIDDYTLNNFLDYVHNVFLDEVNRATVDKYKSHRIQSVGPGTVNIELRTLRCAYNYALQSGYVKNNPFSKQKYLSAGEDDLSEFLEVEEIEAMRKAIEDNNDIKYRRVFEFYLNTGSRRAEALSLEWKDVNFERRFVFLRHTKTGKTRMVPMNETLYQVLKEMHEENSKEKPFSYYEDTVTRYFKKYLRKSGIEKDLHLHNLRDTFASHLIMQGVDLLTVSRYLGHSNIKITEKYYGHLSPGHYHNSINKLPY